MIPLLDAPAAADGPAGSPLPAGPCRVLVLGIGNLLMGDEGAGIHVLRRLERQHPARGVRLLDGGTGGVTLLGELEAAEAVVLIDATRDGTRAGTVRYRYRRHGEFGDLPPEMSAHEFGLKDLFAAARLRGALPAIHLYTIAVETVKPMSTELSEAVDRSVAAVAGSAGSLARRLAA